MPPLRLVVAEVDWPAPWSDSWLRATANEQLAMGVLVAADASWHAAPYDGGLDLVASDLQTRDDLIRRHRLWRPASGDL